MKKKKFPEMPWDQVFDRVEKNVFRLYCGNSAGTCFLISLGFAPDKSQAFAMLATAWHVIEDLVSSTDDIRLVSADKTKVFDSKNDEISFMPLGDAIFDTAFVIVKTGKPLLKETEMLPILPFELMLPKGADIAWVGFPGIVEPELCFFHGYISGYLNEPPTYLVDGVAINGVSGGPAFDNRAHLIGLVSAYIPNQIDEKTTLPGLMTLVPINAIRYFVEHRLGATVL